MMNTSENAEVLNNITWLAQACILPGVGAIGSAPYVEPNESLMRLNIRHLFALAIDANVHLDFHLDYNVDSSKEALIWFVLEQLQGSIDSGKWPSGKRVSIGHATRLNLWDDLVWKMFTQVIAEKNLPVSLIGLPQSDMYMMGRELSLPPRTTLNVCRLASRYNLKVAMAVNNIENAFTPQGPPDPLALCPLGVALFQAGTVKDCHTLLVSLYFLHIHIVVHHRADTLNSTSHIVRNLSRSPHAKPSAFRHHPLKSLNLPRHQVP